MNEIEPPYFQIKVCHIGRVVNSKSKLIGSYALTKNKNARELLYDAIISISNSLVGYDDSYQLICDTTKQLLGSILKEKVKEKKIKDFVETLDKKNWKIVFKKDLERKN